MKRNDSKCQTGIVFFYEMTGEVNSPELKQLVSENHDLEYTENKYEELLESPEYKDVADDLHTIKKLREEITLFLSDQGVVLPRF